MGLWNGDWNRSGNKDSPWGSYRYRRASWLRVQVVAILAEGSDSEVAAILAEGSSVEAAAILAEGFSGEPAAVSLQSSPVWEVDGIFKSGPCLEQGTQAHIEGAGDGKGAKILGIVLDFLRPDDNFYPIIHFGGPIFCHGLVQA